MDLDTVAAILAAFYRLTGSETDDSALTDHGEATDEVAYQYLTRGCRKAQRWMLKMGYGGWRQRTAALSFSGTDAADGGRYVALPSDFLKLFGDRNNSALRQANGDRWGQEIDALDDHVKGDAYYVRGDQLWLARTAAPPTTLYLDYHYLHPAWDSSLLDADIDFPLEARPLIVAEAANVAKEENWLPGGPEMEQKIERALVRARNEAMDIAKRSKSARQMKHHRPVGNRW